MRRLGIHPRPAGYTPQPAPQMDYSQRNHEHVVQPRSVLYEAAKSGTLDNVASIMKNHKIGGDQLFDIITTTNKNFDSMPMARAVPTTMLTVPLPYQSQGLQWLLDHEHPKLPVVGTSQYMWQYRPKVAGRSSHYYNNVTNSAVLQVCSPEGLSFELTF